MRKITIFFILLLMVLPPAHAAAIYVYVNASGNRLITDHPRSDLPEAIS